MSNPKIADYGTWKSPITSDLIVTAGVGVGQVQLDGEVVYWTEGRPSEGGRAAIVRRTAEGVIEDVTPLPYNARTGVHEYGGGSYAVSGGVVYFTHFADQRVYKTTPDGITQALTPLVAKRYADLVFDDARNRLVAVEEDHTVQGEAVNRLVAIDAETGSVVPLVQGNDFYSFPTLSPDGVHMAWTTWNHPNMPWDGTELWVGEIQPDGTVQHAAKVAGGRAESIFQPQFNPEGRLFFISDKSDWWNIYALNHDGSSQPIASMNAEFAAPQWVFGLSTYAFLNAAMIAASYTQNGMWYLATIDTRSGQVTHVNSLYTSIGSVKAWNGRVVFRGGSPLKPAAIVSYDVVTGEFTELRKEMTLEMDTKYLSNPSSIEFPTERGLTAHAIYYPPCNADFEAPSSEKPPLLLISHGGPTSATSASFNLQIQYWTSRGFAVVDVNYGGSTGYGRAYRQRLNGQWGVVDIEDCCNAALYLANQGKADKNRLTIMGGSAGGYTTLAALTFREVFSAGASYFGVSDMELLALETHKFESRYMDSMVGPYPDALDLYRARSPVYFTDRLNCPVIFFQGAEDKIVLPNQAELMVEALQKKGVPVAYLLYEGEGHGFRKAENIKRSLDGQFYFFAKIFGYEPADAIAPVAIDNL